MLRYFLSIIIFFSFLKTQTIAEYSSIFNNSLTPGILSKKNNSSFSFTHTSAYSFDAYNNNQTKKVLSNILLKSGIEFVLGKYIRGTDNFSNIDIRGINYHIKKKKFGITLHFTSYKHNAFNILDSKPRENGISIHLRFKKKKIKPYLYYGHINLYNDEPKMEIVSFGVLAKVNRFVLGSYLVIPLEDSLNFENVSANYNLILCFIVD